MNKGFNLVEKLIRSHLVSGEMRIGSEIGISIDQTLTQDPLGTMAYLQFEAMGVPRVKTKLSVSYVDHCLLQEGFENSDDHRYLQTVAAKYGILFSKPGNGICHQVHLERFSRPGETLIGADSHTPTCGAVGMLAIGAGGRDVAVAMAGGAFYLAYPKVLRINLQGRLRPWSTAKDVILEISEKTDDQGERGKGDRVRRSGDRDALRSRAIDADQHGGRARDNHLALPERRGHPAVLRGPGTRGGLARAPARPGRRLRRDPSTSIWTPSSPTSPCPTRRTTSARCAKRARSRPTRC